MTVSLSRAAEILKEHDGFLILCHAHPDGDTLGSAAALCRRLISMGKRAAVHCNDEIPAKFAYLFEGLSSEEFEPQFIISVDVGALSLLGRETVEKYGDRVGLSIDHHGTADLFADESYIDSAAAANCENIYLLIKELGGGFDKKTADCIYTGIATDTGCFRYTNVTARTLRIAAEMLEAGADTATINRVMFETKTKQYAALERLALDSMDICMNGKAAVITLTREMFEKSGAHDSDSDGIAALPRQIEGVLIGATLREKEGGKFKISLRTHEPVDAAQICKALGGGGHMRAAGCEIKGTAEEVKNILLKTAEKFI